MMYGKTLGGTFDLISIKSVQGLLSDVQNFFSV